jgi:hypothetical protein
VLQVLTLMQMNTRTGSKKVRCSHANDAKLLKFCQRTIDCGISVLNTKELLAKDVVYSHFFQAIGSMCYGLAEMLRGKSRVVA